MRVNFALFGSVFVKDGEVTYENVYTELEKVRDQIIGSVPTVELYRHEIFDVDGGEWDDGS
jgi:hypothetical protein